ncbi:MAG: ATP-dependent sacrificial sulfur transferase LarE [Desulfobacterales bacterium]|jgi:uncharacterized protein|nr:ATP-dependent sacrificial sulfur transferase LarE [Desulfobacterales bacterium]
MRNEPEYKKKQLAAILSRYDAMAVAFSGGVDSTFLLAMAKRCLGKKALAVTADSPFFPRRELVFAKRMADKIGVDHLVLPIAVLDDREITDNPPERCYFCKRLIFTALATEMAKRRIEVLAHGANLDDQSDYRPGARAAFELGVVAPLTLAGLNKSDIRILSEHMGLETWNKPAMACLASRIPYGTRIDPNALDMVEKAEAVLQDLGFAACRVRHHGRVARIEIPEDDLQHILEVPIRNRVVSRLIGIGYLHVALDLEGYVRGGMNRAWSVEHRT